MGDEQKAKKVPQFLAGLGAAMGGFNSGCALGWASGGMKLIKNDRGENKLVDPWITSILNIGAIGSLLVTAVLLEKLGRKWSLLAFLPLFAVCWVGLAFVHHDVAYIVIRFLMGFSAGIYCVACPVYSGEIAQTEVRGTLGVCFQLFITLGILFSYTLAWAEDFVIFHLAMLVPLIIFVVWMIFLPESPYYLAAKGDDEKTRSALQWLRGKDYNADGEFQLISSTVQKKKELVQTSLRDLVTKKPLRRALFLGLFLMLCQQLCGINAVIFNMETIFDAAKGDDKKGGLTANQQSIIVGVVQVLITFVAAVCVDRFGRKVLMILSMCVMGIAHIGLFVFFLIKETGDDDTASALSLLPVVCLCLFIAGFSIGTGPVPWCMMGEIFSEEAKSISASIAGILNWSLSFCVTWIFEFLIGNVPNWVFFITFSAVCFVGVVGLMFVMLETKGRDFETIQGILEGTNPEMAPLAFKS